MIKDNKNNRAQALIFSGLLLASGSAIASMGNIGTAYGVLPSDVATAQALSIFSTQASAVYYNPAYIATDPRGELTLGLMESKPELRINSKWSDGTLTRSGSDVLNSTPSRQVLVGMKTDLSSLTKYHKPTYLGVMIGMEKFGNEMLSFDSHTAQEGQYFGYGKKPLFLVVGGGTNLWRGVSVGASLRVTLHSTATLNASTTLKGVTSYEELNVSAKPKFRPIVGVNVDWGKTFCGDESCWLSGWQTALAWRAYSNTETTVNSDITIPGTVPAPGVGLVVKTLDSYQPNIYSAGLLYGHEGHYRIGVTAEFQQWSKLEDELKSDTIKDQAVKAAVGQLKFRDVWVPRIGGQFWVMPNWILSTGVAYEQTPLDSNSSLDVNYLDADKVVYGIGLSWQIKHPFVLAYPLRISFAYQYQQLIKQDFDFYTSKPKSGVKTTLSNPRHFETVEASGDVNVFGASVTLKF